MLVAPHRRTSVQSAYWPTRLELHSRRHGTRPPCRDALFPQRWGRFCLGRSAWLATVRSARLDPTARHAKSQHPFHAPTRSFPLCGHLSCHVPQLSREWGSLRPHQCGQQLADEISGASPHAPDQLNSNPFGCTSRTVTSEPPQHSARFLWHWCHRASVKRNFT